MKYYGIYFCALLWEWERTAFCFSHNWKPEVWQPTVLMHVKFLGIFGISEKCAVTPGADQDFVPSGNREGIILLEWSLQDFFSDNSGWGSQWCFRVLFSGLFFFSPGVLVSGSDWFAYAPVPEQVLPLVNWKVVSVVLEIVPVCQIVNKQSAVIIKIALEIHSYFYQN